MKLLHPLGAGQHRPQVGRDLVDPGEEGCLPVVPGGHELVVHQVDGDQHGAVARGEGEGALVLADVEPDVVERDALPVAPDIALHDGLAQGFLRADGAGNHGVRPVRADDEAGSLHLPASARSGDHDASDPAVALDETRDAGAIAELRAGGDRRLGKHGIQQVAPGAVGLIAAAHRGRRSLEHGAVQVDPPAGEGRRAGGDLRQDAPVAQVSDAQGVDEVRRLPHVAGEAIAVEQQDAIAPAGQQHGRGRAGAAGADDDRVVDGAPPRASVPLDRGDPADEGAA